MIERTDGTADYSAPGEHDVAVSRIELGIMDMVRDDGSIRCLLIRYTGTQPDGKQGRVATVFSDPEEFVNLLEIIKEGRDLIRDVFPGLNWRYEGEN